MRGRAPWDRLAPVSATAPRLTIRIGPTPPNASSFSWLPWALAAVMIALGIAFPRQVGLPVVVPALFTSLAVAATRRLSPRPRGRQQTLRFGDDGLEFESDVHLGLTPWTHVAAVVEHPAHVAIELRSGQCITIADTEVPGGRDALRAALPEGIPSERPAAPSKRSNRVVAWLIVAIVAYGIWHWRHP